MKVEIIENRAGVNITSPETTPHTVVALEGLPGEQGPQGEPGQGDRLRTGTMAARPSDPEVGEVYITTDTDELYVAINVSE